MSNIEKYKRTLSELHAKLNRDIEDTHARLLSLGAEKDIVVHDIQNMIKGGTSTGSQAEDLSWLNLDSVNDTFVSTINGLNIELKEHVGEHILFQYRYDTHTDLLMSQTVGFSFGIGVISKECVTPGIDFYPELPVSNIVVQEDLDKILAFNYPNPLSRLFFAQLLSKLKGEGYPHDFEWSVYIGDDCINDVLLMAEGNRKRGIENILSQL